MNKDRAFGIVMLALSAGYYTLATRIPHAQLADAVGPQGLPTVYAVLLAGLSLALIARSRRVPGLRFTPAGGGDSRRVAGLLLIGVLYIVIVPWLGYILSLTGLMVATYSYQGGVLGRRAAFVTVSGALFFWVLFVWLLRISQPAGLWPSLI